MPEIEKWQYIGDGVYIMFDGWGYWLHANNHKDPTDRIYLEPDVLKQLIKFTEKPTASVKIPTLGKTGDQ